MSPSSGPDDARRANPRQPVDRFERQHEAGAGAAVVAIVAADLDDRRIAVSDVAADDPALVANARELRNSHGVAHPPRRFCNRTMSGRVKKLSTSGAA
jgi:hypothetical protein